MIFSSERSNFFEIFQALITSVSEYAKVVKSLPGINNSTLRLVF